MIAFDITWFGYGAGFVMCGWIAGMIVSVALSVLGKMGKLGAFVLVGCLLACGSVHAAGSTIVNGFWSSTSGNPGQPYTAQLTVSCTQDSVGMSYPYLTGGPAVPWVCPGSPGSVMVNVPAIADGLGTVSIFTVGDTYTSDVSIGSLAVGNSSSSLVCFLAGVLTATAFSVAAAGRWL